MWPSRTATAVRNRVFRIGIRQQLTALVIVVALVSLMVLAIITGIYFSTNYKNLRSDRLKVVAQLKAAQVSQNLNFLYYQAYWLATKDVIQNSLVSYRAGNTSEANWASAEDSIKQFLQATITFAGVRLYDTRFDPVVESGSNWSNIYVPDSISQQLYTLEQDNITVPDSIDSTGFISGPVRNTSDSFVMSMTIPIYSQASILFSSQDLVGYVTAVMTAESLSQTLGDNTTTIEDSSVVILIADNMFGNITSNTTYHYAFAKEENISQSFKIGQSDIATQVLKNGKTGFKSKTKTNDGLEIAAGYCPVDSYMATWGAVIEQKRSTFMYPSDQFTKIIVGVCIGIAVFMAIVTFPLAHWAVQPIRELQKATELIAQGRGLQPKRDNDNEKFSSARASLQSTALERFHYPPETPSRSLTPTQSPINATHQVTTTDTGHLESGSMSSGGAMGHPSYLQSARVPHYKRIFYDELSKLTETFNAMTDELDRQYTHLEDRVKARTKQLEAAKIQAEAANEAKTVFIANISHELRTPLNGILGMTAIAMAETDPGKIQQSLKLIFRSGELLLHILTELLTFSKNSLMRSKLENADFSVMEVALQIKSIFGKLAKDQNVNLSILVTSNEIRKMVLYGDSNRIIQIVMNLVSNSLKFTPVDGKVTFTVRRIGEYDEAKSREANYEKVFVKTGTTPINEKQQQKTLNEYGSSASDETDDTHVSSADDGMDDVKSVITVSTSSYDDAIFKNQFKVEDSTSGNDAQKQSKTRPLTDKKTWVFEFVVEDTGPGIDPKLQSAVFEPFVQGDQTLSRQYGGTGLGLSICRQLAAMMKGVMELESTVGVGSKFTFKVPMTQTGELVVDETDANLYEDEFNIDSKKNRKVKIVEPESSVEDDADAQDNVFSPSPERSGYYGKAYLNSTGTAKASSSSLHSTLEQSKKVSPSKSLKILVAEDNNVNQEVIKRMLNLEGFTDIELAVDGQEAIALVQNKLSSGGTYDVIFMDVQMPNVDGLMATRTIKQELGFKGPIVALTAFADESNVKECLETGMIGFLSKPIRRSQLRKVLTQFCPVEFTEIGSSPSTSDDPRTN